MNKIFIDEKSQQPSNTMLQNTFDEINKYKNFDEFCIAKKCTYKNEIGDCVVNVYPIEDMEKYETMFIKKLCETTEDYFIFDKLSHLYNYDENGKSIVKVDRQEFCPRDFWSIMLKKYKFKK